MTSNDINPFDNTPLGVDAAAVPEQPEAETETVATPEVPVAPTQPTVPQGKKELDEKDYLLLRQKADLFGIIENDPNLHALVLDYVQKAQQTSPTAKAPTTPLPPEFDSLRKENEQMKEMMKQIVAKEQIRDFASTHPDFTQYKDSMAKLLDKHATMTLEEAYTFAKSSSKPAQRTGTATAGTKLATPEGKNTGGSVTDSTDLDEMIKKINNPKATPRVDDYLDLAFKAAQRKLASSRE